MYYGINFRGSVNLIFNETQTTRFIDFISKPVPRYDVNDYNCTNYVLDAMNAASIQLPRSTSRWPYGGGLNPGALGQDLRGFVGANSGKNLAGGNAGSVAGECQ